MLEPRTHTPGPLKGRGAVANPTSRFERLHYESDPEFEQLAPEEHPAPKTRVYLDRSRSAITYNKSPDIPFDAGLNPYRGCEHGCSYCYARPSHEYLGLSAGLDFETRIFAKPDLPALLRAELMQPSWQPQTIAMSGITDCYQPVERQLKITRSCLEVLADFRNPVGIITKNALVTRDIDILQSLAQHDAAMVMVSITTLQPELAMHLEPRASTPAARLRAIRELAAAGIRVGVMTAPVIPGLTDEEIPAILAAAAEAGATMAGYVMLRLPHGVADLFDAWLETHYPNRRARVMDRVRAMRGGERNTATFGDRMQGEGVFAQLTQQLFRRSCAKHGLNEGRRPLSVDAFRRHDARQPDLFDI